MIFARLFLLPVCLVALVRCNEPGASITIKDARAWRDAERRVVVDIDVIAHEALGDNIGTYCTRVTFTGQAVPAEQCSADLTDPDTKTIRVRSDGDLPAGAAINVRVRLGAVDQGRSLAAP
jgi:hypothetical protein